MKPIFIHKFKFIFRPRKEDHGIVIIMMFIISIIIISIACPVLGDPFVGYGACWVGCSLQACLRTVPAAHLRFLLYK